MNEWPPKDQVIGALISLLILCIDTIHHQPKYHSRFIQNNIFNYKYKNYKLWRKNKIELISFCNILLFLSHLRSFLLDFFALKCKIEKFNFFERRTFFFRVNIYSFTRRRTCYGVTVYIGPTLVVIFTFQQLGMNVGLVCKLTWTMSTNGLSTRVNHSLFHFIQLKRASLKLLIDLLHRILPSIPLFPYTNHVWWSTL